MKIRLIDLSVFVACLVSTSFAIAATQFDSVTVGYSSFSADYVPLWTAVEERLG